MRNRKAKPHSGIDDSTTMKCPRCHAEVVASATLCPLCGASLQAVPGRARICARCGQTLQSDDRFCGNCGTTVGGQQDFVPPDRPPIHQTVICQYCGGEGEAQDLYCGYCGASLRADAGMPGKVPAPQAHTPAQPASIVPGRYPQQVPAPHRSSCLPACLIVFLIFFLIAICGGGAAILVYLLNNPDLLQ